MKQLYDTAAKSIGTWEWAEGSNPVIDQFFAESGHPGMRDDTAWCAAFVGAVLKRCGLDGTGSLAARSYLKWGQPVELDDAQPGDVVVFWRGSRHGWQGHVGFYADHDARQVLVLGGNQRDQVNVTGYSRDRLLAVRRAEQAAEPRPAPRPEPAPTEARDTPSQAPGVAIAVVSALAILLLAFGILS